ncbi:MAG TPA: ATP-binding protein, partial [Luteitalea sp.]|nr:ATP-binding protein [Luteitalea sp.]
MIPLQASGNPESRQPGNPANAYGTWQWDQVSDALVIATSDAAGEATTRTTRDRWLATLAGPERGRVRHAWDAAAAGQPLPEFEVDVVAGAEVRRCLLRGHGRRRPDTPGAAGIWLDVTTRNLGQGRSWLRHLADAMPIMVWATTPNGIEDYANEAWRQYTGLSDVREWALAVHPDDVQPLRERWQAALDQQTRFEARCRLRRETDGSYRWHSVRAVPIVDAHGVLIRWLGAFVDDHELRMLIEANQQLLVSEQRARQAAEDAGRMKDEFLATLGHELRTPLNAISGWTSMLKRGGLSDQDMARAVEVIERNADAQRHLIEELLDVSRIISGHIRLDVQPVRIQQIVTHAVEALRPVADAKGVAVRVDATDAGLPVRGDASRLQQVFANLIGNAVKFTPTGGEVAIAVGTVGREVQVRVQDTGLGIAPAFLPYVFDRFRQAESPTSRRFGGLGLGLSIVRQIVHMHGGRVVARSDGEGRGAEFLVALGLDGDLTAATVPSTSEAGRLESATSPLRGLSILVIEDDADSREMLSVLLENAGAVPVPAATVTEALRLLGDLEIDVVLSDIGMPERDGFDLIRSLRTFPNPRVRSAPALAVTAFTRVEDRERILAAGFDAHVSKPVEPLELFQA